MRVAEIQPRFRIGRGVARRVSERLQGTAVIAGTQLDQADVVMGFGVVRTDLERPVQHRAGARVVAGGDLDLGQDQVVVRPVGVAAKTFVEDVGRQLRATESQVRERHRVEDVEVARVFEQDLASLSDHLVVPALVKRDVELGGADLRRPVAAGDLGIDGALRTRHVVIAQVDPHQRHHGRSEGGVEGQRLVEVVGGLRLLPVVEREYPEVVGGMCADDGIAEQLLQIGACRRHVALLSPGDGVGHGVVDRVRLVTGRCERRGRCRRRRSAERVDDSRIGAERVGFGDGRRRELGRRHRFRVRHGVLRTTYEGAGEREYRQEAEDGGSGALHAAHSASKGS